MQCIFHFSQQFFTPSLKIVIPKQYKKGKSVFSLTETKLILVPMCHVKREQLFCSCIYTKTERKWSQLFKETTWAVKLSRHWSGCKCTNIQTCFSMHCQHTPLSFWYIALFFFFNETSGPTKKATGSDFYFRCCIMGSGGGLLARKIKVPKCDSGGVIMNYRQ